MPASYLCMRAFLSRISRSACEAAAAAAAAGLWKGFVPCGPAVGYALMPISPDVADSGHDCCCCDGGREPAPPSAREAAVMLLAVVLLLALLMPPLPPPSTAAGALRHRADGSTVAPTAVPNPSGDAAVLLGA